LVPKGEPNGGKPSLVPKKLKGVVCQRTCFNLKIGLNLGLGDLDPWPQGQPQPRRFAPSPKFKRGTQKEWELNPKDLEGKGFPKVKEIS